MSDLFVRRVECPICCSKFPQSIINEHVDKCLADTEVSCSNASNDVFEHDSFPPVDKRAKMDAEATTPPPGTRDGQSQLWDNEDENAQFLACDEVNGRSSVVKQSWKSFFQKCAKQSTMLSNAATQRSPNPRNERSVVRMNNVKHDWSPDRSVSPARNHISNTRLSSNAVAKDFFDTAAHPTMLSKVQQEPKTQSIQENDCHSRLTLLLAEMPLAERMRPTKMEHFFGQAQVVGTSKPLHALITASRIVSMIFWGPPGCGKTTLAKIISNNCKQHSSSQRFVTLSAATAAIADVKEAIKIAKNERSFGRKTILFVDEIHRFNKLQQDAFLPHVEDGTIVLLGATTENPSFHVNNALLSRCQVVVLDKLAVDNVVQILSRTLSQLNIVISEDSTDEHSKESVVLIERSAVELLASFADGDARHALNGLHLVLNYKLTMRGNVYGHITITEMDVKDSQQRSRMLYDRAGDEHYHCASALQKSIRGSDDNAAIYWLARMLEGGEDPMFIARRLVVTASEDVGLADAQALPLAVATFQACHFLGLPECSINLAHCTTYLARAKKSNESYAALSCARESIRQYKGPLPGVPLHLRNATSELALQLGYHVGYQYNHSIDGPVDQLYLPTELTDANFFLKR